MNDLIESYLGVTEERKKSRTPAKLDFIQSTTGLILALFMWAHMIFVASILFGNEAMYQVTKMMEASFLIHGGSPIIVTIFAIIIAIIFIVHAIMGVRKLPINYKQYKLIRTHSKSMAHGDTKLWFVQAYTGFAMFFLGSIHLFIIMTHSNDIGPYASSDRVWSAYMWPLYILLLLAVEFHGSIGLYRLCIKWGWFEGKTAKESRIKLKRAKWIVTIIFLLLGVLSLAAYIKIGIYHADNAGQRYTPTAYTQTQINIPTHKIIRGLV